MIFAKTVCRRPGSYVTVVPVGLRATLQYSSNGVIQAIKVHDESGELTQVSDDVFRRMIRFIPQKILLTGGTTWIEGIFYSSNIPTSAGKLPECCTSKYVEMFTRDDCMCAFYASEVNSLAAAIEGVQAVRNWLGLNGFRMLPGLVVPTDFNESSLELLMHTGAYSFKYPYIAGFYVYNGTVASYVSAGLHQGVVQSVESSLTSEGYVQSAVVLDETDNDDPVVLTLNYSDVCSHAIQESACVLYYKDDSVVILDTRSSVPGAKLKVIENKVTCPVCGKMYYAPSHGPVQCDDPHCLSKAYPDVCRMLKAFNLPELSIDDFSQMITKKQVITFTDVLCNEPYSDSEIHSDLASVLRAAVPYSACSDSAFFEALATQCGNAPDTVMYYVNNPNRMLTELELDEVTVRRLMEWFKDEYNVLTVSTLMSAVRIEKPSFKFEGAPIFRGNTIAITGKFKRGDADKIKKILEGYSANVITSIEDVLPNFVITGGTGESINGGVILAARRSNIPVISEDEFFDKYGVIADMMNSHLL